jgi:hypothetical protein
MCFRRQQLPMILSTTDHVLQAMMREALGQDPYLSVSCDGDGCASKVLHQELGRPQMSLTINRSDQCANPPGINGDYGSSL